jgi:hypothetical protein
MPSGVSSTSFGDPAFGSTGIATFGGSATGPGANNTDQGGYWSGTNGYLHLVYRAGDPAPGVTGNPTFGAVEMMSVNSTGKTAFRAELQSPGNIQSGSIWTENAGVLTLIAHQGDHAPGTPDGTTFTGLGFPGINSAGKIAFDGSLDLSFNRQGIWSNAAGPLQLVARKGDPAPGTPSGVTFNELGWGNLVAFNSAGQLAFRGTLTGTGIDATNNNGIWRGTAGALSLVARSGDPAPGLPPGVSFNGLFYPTINSAGDVQFYAELTGAGVDYTNNNS